MQNNKRVTHFDVFNNEMLLKTSLPLQRMTDQNLVDNSYFFNGERLRIKTDSTKFGGIVLKLFKLSNRDTIRISFDVFGMSGDSVKVSLDSLKTNANIDNTEDFKYENRKWIFFDEEITVNSLDEDFKLIIGLYTKDAGEYIIRNLSISVCSNSCIALPNQKFFMIKKDGENWSSDENFSSEKLKFRPGPNALMVDFVDEFRHSGRPVPFAFADYGTKFNVKAGGTTNKSVGFRFYNEKNEMMLLTDLPTSFYFSVMLAQTY